MLENRNNIKNGNIFFAVSFTVCAYFVFSYKSDRTYYKIANSANSGKDRKIESIKAFDTLNLQSIGKETKKLTDVGSFKHECNSLCKLLDIKPGPCCCDHEQMEALNDDVIFPTIHELLHTEETLQKFEVGGVFADPCNEIKFQEFFPGGKRPRSDYQCVIQTCNVDECTPVFKIDEEGPQICSESKTTASEMENPEAYSPSAWDCTPHWREKEIYHLPDQMERHTGYQGQHIWGAMHALANRCEFVDDDPQTFAINEKEDACKEDELLNRILEGMHMSVTLHIAADFCLDCINGTGMDDCTILEGQACRNFGMFPEKYFKSKTSERMSNLFYVYTLVLNAVQKAEKMLTDGDVSDNYLKAVKELCRPYSLCKTPFYDSSSWNKRKIASFKKSFQDICELMNCVGCSRCHLWGKLQVHGIGLAFRILFPEELESVSLSWNDKVALLWTLDRFAKSIYVAGQFEQQARKNRN